MIRRPSVSCEKDLSRWGRPVETRDRVSLHEHGYDNESAIIVNDKVVLVFDADDYTTRVVFDTCCALFNEKCRECRGSWATGDDGLCDTCRRCAQKGY